MNRDKRRRASSARVRVPPKDVRSEIKSSSKYKNKSSGSPRSRRVKLGRQKQPSQGRLRTKSNPVPVIKVREEEQIEEDEMDNTGYGSSSDSDPYEGEAEGLREESDTNEGQEQPVELESDQYEGVEVNKESEPNEQCEADVDENVDLDLEEQLELESEGEGEEVSFSPVVRLYTAVFSQLVCDDSKVDMDLFAEKVPKLRALLLCEICEQLLTAEPVVKTNPTHCPALHPMCKECYGKEWKKPCPLACEKNTDYFENDYFSTILSSYKDFCTHFMQSAECIGQLQKKKAQDPNYDDEALIRILTEGAEAADENRDEAEGEEDAANGVFDADDGDLGPSDDGGDETVNDSKALNPNEDEDIGHETSEPEHTDDWSSLGGSAFGSASAGAQFNLDNIRQSVAYSTRSAPINVMERLRPTTAPPMTITQPVTNWPDPKKVMLYACGNGEAAMQITGAHSLNPVSKPSNSIKTSTVSTPTVSPIKIKSEPTAIVGSVVHAVSENSKKLKVRLPLPHPSTTLETSAPNGHASYQSSVASTSKGITNANKGCRCGMATSAPGKLTCCGQRCPCYAANMFCMNCKCKGCRNPYLPGGRKLLKGINAVIDTKTNKTTPLPPGTSTNIFVTMSAGTEGTYTIPMTSTSMANFGDFTFPMQLPLEIVDVTNLVPPEHQLQEITLVEATEHNEVVQIIYEDEYREAEQQQ